MPYVTTNHPRLTLEGAEAVLSAAKEHAARIGVPMNIAIVDDGGFEASHRHRIAAASGDSPPANPQGVGAPVVAHRYGMESCGIVPGGVTKWARDL